MSKNKILTLLNDGLPSWEWAILFGMFCRLEREYRSMGKAGGKLWVRAKVLLFLFSLDRPLKVSIVLRDLGLSLKDEDIAQVIAELLSNQELLELGYARGAKQATKDLDRIIEITPAGRVIAVNFINEYKAALQKEAASIEGFKLIGFE